MQITASVLLVGTLAAFVFGLSKTAIPAVGSFGAALLTLVLPALPSTGVALPVLIVGDLLALGFFGRRADLRLLIRMVPAVAVGVLAGFVLVSRVDTDLAARIIGASLVVSGAGELARRRTAGRGDRGDRSPVSLALGGGAGFSTMVANAGGPMMTLYLLRLDVVKEVFLGTVAWFFFAVNLIKVPFSVALGLIDGDSLRVSLALVPGIVIGALIGRRLVLGMSRRTFEDVALAATASAGVWLLVA